VVAVLGDGVDHAHPDLDPGNRTRVIVGRNVVDENDNTLPDPGYNHETAIAGIIAAITNNDPNSVAGVMWNAKILPVKVNSGQTAHHASAVEWARSHGAHIMNMSWNVDADFMGEAFKDAIRNSYAQGIVLCASMGNDNNGTVRYPAALYGVIAVGGTNQLDDRWSTPTEGSNWGNHVSVVAPATGYRTTTLGGGYAPDFGGTSLATPLVAGSAGLILSEGLDRGHSLTNDDVRAILENTADKVPGMQGNSWTNQYGYGRINVGKAIQKLNLPYEVEQSSVTSSSATLTWGY